MQTNDIVAQEEDHHDHVSSSFLWMRRGAEVTALWERVLELESDGMGREQDRFNKLLGSSHSRRSKHGDHSTRRKEFKSAQYGLRVHALDPDKFYNFRYQLEGAAVGRAHAVSVQTSCGGDHLTNAYLAKLMGFWGNLDSYYSLPPKTITIGHLGGSKADVVQLFRIMLAAG